jgi:hypothetical protein
VNESNAGQSLSVLTRPGISLTSCSSTRLAEDSISAPVSVRVVVTVVALASDGVGSPPAERSASRPAKTTMTATAPTIIQVMPGRMGQFYVSRAQVTSVSLGRSSPRLTEKLGQRKAHSASGRLGERSGL